MTPTPLVNRGSTYLGAKNTYVGGSFRLICPSGGEPGGCPKRCSNEKFSLATRVHSAKRTACSAARTRCAKLKRGIPLEKLKPIRIPVIACNLSQTWGVGSPCADGLLVRRPSARWWPNSPEKKVVAGRPTDLPSCPSIKKLRQRSNLFIKRAGATLQNELPYHGPWSCINACTLKCMAAGQEESRAARRLVNHVTRRTRLRPQAGLPDRHYSPPAAPSSSPL